MRANDVLFSSVTSGLAAALPWVPMNNPNLAYSICTLILCLNITLLWFASGGSRVKTKTTPNPEDAKTVSKGAEVVPENPPEVARVLRAHTNALVNIVPFLFVAQVYVGAGASGTMAWAFFGTFTVARILHSICYLGGIQPWRTASFGVGALATISMMIHAAILLLS